MRRLDSLLGGEDVGNHVSEDADDGRHDAGNDDCEQMSKGRQRPEVSWHVINGAGKVLGARDRDTRRTDWQWASHVSISAISSYIRIWRWPCTTAWPCPCLPRQERSQLGHWRLLIIPTGTTTGSKRRVPSVITVSRVCLTKQPTVLKCICFVLFFLPCRPQRSARIWWTGSPARPRWSRPPGSLPPRTATTPGRAWACWGWPAGWRAPTPSGTPWSTLHVTESERCERTGDLWRRAMRRDHWGRRPLNHSSPPLGQVKTFTGEIWSCVTAAAAARLDINPFRSNITQRRQLGASAED